MKMLCSEIREIHHRLLAHLGSALRLSEPDDTGGYFCLADASSGLPILLVGCGEVPAGKIEKYSKFAQEKVFRLARFPRHLSSWQSRNEAEDKWGGAIRAGEHLLSFSGLLEPVDEALVLRVAIHFPGLFQVGLPKAREIARLSGNTKFQLLLDLDPI